MTQSKNVPRHVAIIMDGNGRWAKRRGLPRSAGHKKGVETVREVVRHTGELGIEYLTLYSFSSENWSRPRAEISELFSLLRIFIRSDLAEIHENNIRVRLIGSRDNVPEDILRLLDDAIKLTADNNGRTLIIAFNYGSRAEIISAFQKLSAKIVSGELNVEEISVGEISQHLDTVGIPDPDLIIRTSGEVRLSNFLLWQAAYSELVFVDCMWPDFDRAQYDAAIEIYHSRTRRFGSLAQENAS